MTLHKKLNVKAFFDGVMRANAKGWSWLTKKHLKTSIGGQGNNSIIINHIATSIKALWNVFIF
jgi:hypothetical protein